MFDGLTNATAEHRFTGTTISYVARKGPDQGRVKVFIDGVEQDANSSTSAVDPFDLYASTEQLKQVIFTTSSLTNAQHTIRIEQEGTKHAASTSTNINRDAYQGQVTVAKSFDVVTNGAYHMVPYTIGNTQYMAISNYRDSEGQSMSYNKTDTKVYSFDPVTGFSEIAILGTNGALGVEHFTIGTDHYLAVTNCRRDPTPYLSSPGSRTLWASPVAIYKWYPSQNNGKGGFDSNASAEGVDPLQTINGYGPTDVEFFEEGGEKYLVIGSYYEHSSTWDNGYTEVFRWNNSTGKFETKIQRIPVKEVNQLNQFRLGGDLYLGIASETGSKIYKWGATANGGNPGFAVHQSLMGANAIEFFAMDGRQYVAMVGKAPTIVSQIDTSYPSHQPTRPRVFQ